MRHILRGIKISPGETSREIVRQKAGGVGLLAEKPGWLEGKRVCLIDASDQAVYGSKKSDYRLHYGVDLFTLDVVEMHLSEITPGERVGNFECFGAGDVVIGDRAYGNIQGIEYLPLRICARRKIAGEDQEPWGRPAPLFVPVPPRYYRTTWTNSS